MGAETKKANRGSPGKGLAGVDQSQMTGTNFLIPIAIFEPLPANAIQPVTPS
jgi:hypothetical protein